MPAGSGGWVHRRDSTKAGDQSSLRSLVLPVFAAMPIGAIGLYDVQEWIAELVADGNAPATIRNAYQPLGRICNDALTPGLIARTSCCDINPPKIQDTEKRFLSPTEIAHLANTIDPRYRALVITAGLIDQHLDDYPPGPDGLIFTAPGAGPIRRNAFRNRVWLPAVADSAGQPMRFHDLRNSHVALLIAQGAHPAVIASRLGHTSVKTVLDVYGHLYEGLDRNATDTRNPPWDPSDVDAMWARRTRGRDQGRGLT
jgi:integrase